MFTLGIDLGGTNVKAGICDGEGRLIKKMSLPTEKNANADSITDSMARLSYMLLKECELTPSDLEYVGVAAPGTVDLEKGEIVFCNNLPFLYYPIATEFPARFPVKKLYLENDANAAALGEVICGGAKGVKNAVIITLGTGVGSGIIIDGKIYSGFNYAGGELGHMVIQLNGRDCTCGRKGCFEAYSSATGLINTTREVMEQNPDSLMWQVCAENGGEVNGQTAFRAYDKGDAAAKQVVDSYIEALSCGIINIINIFEPEAICIGGGISNEGDNLFIPLMEHVNKEQYSRFCDNKTEIRLARLGNDAGIIGAAMLGRQQ